MPCVLCEGKAEKVLDLGRQPLANKYPKVDEYALEEFFPLEAFFCTACLCIQLGTTISRARMFEDYYYLSSVNRALVQHFDALAEQLKGSKFVVDVGSNDGILLRPLKERGVHALGVDPSVNVSKIANDAGLTTIVSFFDAATVERIRKEHGSPDVIVASSIFTHVDNPHRFIEDARMLLSDDGRLIIEVEYLGNIVRDVQFERFYLDRIFYYSLTSLVRLFQRHDMYVFDAEMIAPHGGSLRVFVGKNNADLTARASAMLEAEKKSLTSAAFDDFRRQVDIQVRALRATLDAYKRSGLRVAGYGAPARVSTICNYGKIGPELVEYIVDDSPLKQGRYSPGTHIPIVDRSHLEAYTPDVLIVFAHEYIDDIKKKTGGRYRYVVPIPPREV